MSANSNSTKALYQQLLTMSPSVLRSTTARRSTPAMLQVLASIARTLAGPNPDDDRRGLGINRALRPDVVLIVARSIGPTPWPAVGRHPRCACTSDRRGHRVFCRRERSERSRPPGVGPRIEPLATPQMLETFPCFIPVLPINSETVNGSSISARNNLRREDSDRMENSRAAS